MEKRREKDCYEGLTSDSKDVRRRCHHEIIESICKYARVEVRGKVYVDGKNDYFSTCVGFLGSVEPVKVVFKESKEERDVKFGFPKEMRLDLGKETCDNVSRGRS